MTTDSENVVLRKTRLKIKKVENVLKKYLYLFKIYTYIESSIPAPYDVPSEALAASVETSLACRRAFLASLVSS